MKVKTHEAGIKDHRHFYYEDTAIRGPLESFHVTQWFVSLHPPGHRVRCQGHFWAKQCHILHADIYMQSDMGMMGECPNTLDNAKSMSHVYTIHVILSHYNQKTIWEYHPKTINNAKTLDVRLIHHPSCLPPVPSQTCFTPDTSVTRFLLAFTKGCWIGFWTFWVNMRRGHRLIKPENGLVEDSMYNLSASAYHIIQPPSSPSLRIHRWEVL